jgi:beta-glucanase (GH16 family)
LAWFTANIDGLQLNAMVFTGTYNPNCTTSVRSTEDPMSELGFDAETDFHVYDVEWTPTDVKYFADGVLLRTWTKNISLLQRPMNILLTIWASNASGWAGAIDETTIIPSSAQVDWIKVYEYK